MKRVLALVATVLGVFGAVALVAMVQGGTGAAPVATLVGADQPDRPAPIAELAPAAPAPAPARDPGAPRCTAAEKDGPLVCPTTVRPSAPTPTEEPARYYADCDAVRAAGAAPIRRGQPGYATYLDRDGDGVGCEPER